MRDCFAHVHHLYAFIISSLLYPPSLPKFLTPMLDAPMPYLCGISREIFPLALADISDETVVVDLDRNVITMGPTTPDLPALPSRRKLKLEATLEKHAGDVFWRARGLTAEEVELAQSDDDQLAKLLGTADAVWDEKICAMDEAFNLAHSPDSMSLMYSDDVRGLDAKQSRWDAVQEAFLRFYVSMLKDYSKFMPSSTSMNKQSTSWRDPASFNDGRFLTEEFLQSQLPDFHPFLEELVGTQMFDEFITRRMYNSGDAPDIVFFDQSIDAKRNRSKLKLKKKETPFLHSASAHRKMKQIKAIEPNRDNIPKRIYTYPTWPEIFDESLYSRQTRAIPKIITAEFDRRSALTAMLKAKNGTAGGRMLPGSNNPSPEATAFVLFFVTFSTTIGKEWTELEKQRAIREQNLLDQESINGVSIEASLSETPWRPKVNPPWMEREFFHSLHSSFRPSTKPDPPEDVETDPSTKPDESELVVHDDGHSGMWAPDCTDFCGIRKAIDPSTFMGSPWTKRVITTHESERPDVLVTSASEEERVNEMEKAKSIAKAQIDLGYNTLIMMRLRKLPAESVTYKTLIEACGRCGIAHRAQRLIEMMTQDGMALDSEVSYALMKAIDNADIGDQGMLHSSRITDTASEFSVNTSTHSATSSGFTFLNTREMAEHPSAKSSSKSNGTKFDDFHNSLGKHMSSTIESNRRAFKRAKSRRLRRLFKQKITKRKDLHVTHAIKTHLELGYCLLGDLYPGIKIDPNDTCPKCSRVLGQDDIISGWIPCQIKDFSTTCPTCKHKFVPKFSVACSLESFEGSQGRGTTLYCDYLSPWVLLQEIRSMITDSVGGKAAKVLGVESNDMEQLGIDKIIDPSFREGTGINATLWWNMIVTFFRFKIPFTFLLQGSYKDQQLIMPTLEDM